VSTELASYSLEGTTAVIRMDDGKANALSREMIDAVLAALTRAETEASAIVLTGRPDKFCAGFDLRVMMSGPQNAIALLQHGAQLLLSLYGTPLPLVVACSGHAMAGGSLVVLTGDVRIAAAGPYKIGLNEVAIGLPVPVLAMELARDRLTPAALPYATLGARIYSPEEAVGSGYVDEVAPTEGLMARALMEAGRLGALPKAAYAATKLRLRRRTIEYIRASLGDDLRTLLPGS
jgi:enoyl-CoA hydratase